jgi:hypothetical protein
VWTWNAIGKSPGAWRLSPDANESRRGFLLNHVISEELPDAGGPISNSDPVTGQAAWYDVRVRIRPAEEGEPEETWPRADPVPAAPGTVASTPSVLAWFAGRKARP